MKSFQQTTISYVQNLALKLAGTSNDDPAPDIYLAPKDAPIKKASEKKSSKSNAWKINLKKFAAFLGKDKNLTKAIFLLWVISVVGLLIITLILIYGSLLFFSNYQVGIRISVGLWAILFGTWILFFLPSKVVTAVFGSFLGVSLNEVNSASGLLTKTNEAITSLAKVIGGTTNPTDKTDPFIGTTIWIFVVIVTVLCLPAFFSDD